MSGLLGPVTSNRNMLAQAVKARNKPPLELKENTPQGLLDAAALAMSPVPIAGDAVGLLADGHRFVTQPESRTPLNFGLAALGLIPFLPPLVNMGLSQAARARGLPSTSLPTGPGRNQAGAIVYHGSPHKFDKFDSSKIGTGEGAQAYGHGLYFAESPEVARSYQRALAKDRNAFDLNTKMDMVMVGDKKITDYNVNFDTAFIDAARNGPDALRQVAEKDLSRWRALSVDESYPFKDYAKEKVSGYTSLLNDLNGKQVGYVGDGMLYKVDLPDEAIAKMLDWDAPLNKQPAEVRTALKNLGITVDDRALSSFDDALLSALSGGPTSLPKQPLNPAGESVYRKLGGADTAAKKLKEQGIPGIRYLDGGSRNVGEGTRNFVVFPGNEGLLKILERQ